MAAKDGNRESVQDDPSLTLTLLTGERHRREGGWQGELVHTKRAGTKVTVASSWTTLKDVRGKPAGWLEIDTDVTERKQAEESLRRLSVRLLQAQDEERRRIARELHDGVGQYLAAIMMALDAARQNPASADAKLDEADAVARTCMAEIRTLSHLLHPPLLEEVGLGSAVTHYVEGFSSRSGIEVQTEIPDELRRLENNIEIVLFRVLQESLTNVHRHSGSKTAIIRIGADSQKAWLEVQDQGKGSIDVSDGDSSARFREGVGITGMQERVRELGGVLEIMADQKGTRVRVVVPLTAEPRKITADGKAFSATVRHR